MHNGKRMNTSRFMFVAEKGFMYRCVVACSSITILTQQNSTTAFSSVGSPRATGGDRGRTTDRKPLFSVVFAVFRQSWTVLRFCVGSIRPNHYLVSTKLIGFGKRTEGESRDRKWCA